MGIRRDVGGEADSGDFTYLEWYNIEFLLFDLKIKNAERHISYYRGGS